MARPTGVTGGPRLPAIWPGVLTGLVGTGLVLAGPVLVRLGGEAASPVPGAPPESVLAFGVRLGLLGALMTLLVVLGRSAVRRGPHPGRRWTWLTLLPGLSVAGVFVVPLYTALPVGMAPLAVGGLLAGLTLGRSAALLVAAGSVALVGVGQGAAADTVWRMGAGALLAAVLVWPRRLSTLPLAGLAGAALQGALTLVAPGAPGITQLEPLALQAGGSAVAGVAALVLALPGLWWTGTTSARRLRRLTAPRAPLLVELRRRATGTFRHGLNVARLAEAGARALGADVLLVRAAACYHDLGKLVGPEHFEENDAPAGDPNLRLSAEESALRLRRHVRDGLALAGRYRLPRELHPFIAQHHGTGEVRGPSDRARREGRTLDPAVYHYPGPLPQSREAAILMVCDAVEAASRRIGDPSLAEVSRVVEEVVDRLMTEYQFEDCDVSQVDLMTLQEALVRSLRQGLHRRRPAPTPETP